MTWSEACDLACTLQKYDGLNYHTCISRAGHVQDNKDLDSAAEMIRAVGVALSARPPSNFYLLSTIPHSLPLSTNLLTTAGATQR